METLYRFLSNPNSCSYLPDRLAQMEYEVVSKMSTEEYSGRIHEGWRRFGHTLFRPHCENCKACQSLRVPTAEFAPNRSQKRTWKKNQDIRLEVIPPRVTRIQLKLYDTFHQHQADHRDWNYHGQKDANDYQESFVLNPIHSEQWNYYLDNQLVGVGHVDPLPDGLSAIYFYHAPDHRERSLGTFNVLRIIHQARCLNLPYVYLGFFVDGCLSLQYKANFQPNEILTPELDWIPFRSRSS